MIITETERLVLRRASEDDIEFIIELENDEDNRRFVWQGSREEHKRELTDPDFMVLVFEEKDGGGRIGYSLNHIDRKSNIFELRRIVLSVKGRGYGKEVLKEHMRYAFTELGTNRFWLDVYPDNVRGIALYESAGMYREGVLRQNYLSERGYMDQIIYSVLRSEYFKK